MKRFELTAEAERNLEDILVYVEKSFGPDVADRVHRDFLSTFELLAEHSIGRPRPELWPEPFLFWPVPPSLVAFLREDDRVVIIAIHRAERDWRRLRP